jgi:WD40 repeat protein
MIVAGLPAAAADKTVRNDAHGDPLPDGALARLGTIRFRDGHASGACALSPDGKLIAVPGNGIRPARLLDVLTGKEVRQMKNALNSSNFLAFSPDGKVLASSNFSSQLTLWNAETGDVLQTLSNGQQPVSNFSFSGDGKHLVTGNASFGQNNDITVWEVATSKKAATVEPLQNYNVRAVLSADGKMMASWGQYIQRMPMPMGNRQEEQERARTIQLWDVGAGKEQLRIKPDQNYYVTNVLLAPDGKTLVTSGGQGAIVVWDTATGKELRRIAGRRNLGQTMIFSPDGKLFAATTPAGAIQVWEYATGKRLGVHELPLAQGMRIAFTSDNKLLAWQANGQAISIWDVRTEKPLTPVAGHDSSVSAVAFSPNGQTLHSMSIDGTICRWETATGKETGRRTLRDDDSMVMFHGRGGRQQQGGAVSPDGKYLLTSEFNGATLWDMATGREICSFPGGFNPFGMAAVFSPDSNRLALGGLDPRGQAGAVRIFDVNSGQEVKQLDVGAEQLRGLAFAPDGKYLAAFTQLQQGVGSQEVRLWNVADGKKRWQVSRPGYSLQTMAFAPDGISVAICEAGAISMLLATTGEELRRFVAKEGMNNIQRLAFAPDGRTLAVAGLQPDGRSGRVHVWELSTGTLRQDLGGHQGMITSLAFAPDGSKLATGGNDTSILLWDLVGRDAGAKPAAKEVDELWAALDNVDGKEGFRAMGRLLAAPADAAALFRKNLEPVKGEKSDAEKIAQWVSDLDHKRFNKREEASKQLELVGKAAEDELKKALADNPSTEKKKRITELLGKLQTTGIKPELVRPLRAIELLERLGTTEARQVLETLAGGAPEARLTREAKAALERVIKASKPTS